MTRLTRQSGIRVLLGFNRQSALHPWQFALRAAADVVVGDCSAHVLMLRLIAVRHQPVGHLGEQRFEWDAVTALPCGVQILRQAVKALIRGISQNER